MEKHKRSQLKTTKKTNKEKQTLRVYMVVYYYADIQS